MAAPLEKLLYKALHTSSEDDNQLTSEAERLIEKGYPREEIVGYLEKLQRGLIDDGEVELATEALEAVQ